MYFIPLNHKLPLPPSGETFYKKLLFCLILRNVQSFLLCFFHFIPILDCFGIYYLLCLGNIITLKHSYKHLNNHPLCCFYLGHPTVVNFYNSRERHLCSVIFNHMKSIRENNLLKKDWAFSLYNLSIAQLN